MNKTWHRELILIFLLKIQHNIRLIFIEFVVIATKEIILIFLLKIQQNIRLIFIEFVVIASKEIIWLYKLKISYIYCSKTSLSLCACNSTEVF